MRETLSVATLLLGFAFACPNALAQNSPTYSADVPDWITTPDTVQTRIGTLKFNQGAPDEETVKLVYDQLVMLNEESIVPPFFASAGLEPHVSSGSEVSSYQGP